MSKPWKPEEDVQRVRDADPSARWPEGATAGVVLIASCCLGLAILLYRLAGPRDVFGQ